MRHGCALKASRSVRPAHHESKSAGRPSHIPSAPNLRDRKIAVRRRTHRDDLPPVGTRLLGAEDAERRDHAPCADAPDARVCPPETGVAAVASVTPRAARIANGSRFRAASCEAPPFAVAARDCSVGFADELNRFRQDSPVPLPMSALAYSRLVTLRRTRSTNHRRARRPS